MQHIAEVLETFSQHYGQILFTTNVPSKLCACARAHSSWNEHTQENLNSHICSFNKCVLHIFHIRHSKFRWVLVKCCTKQILCEHRL